MKDITYDSSDSGFSSSSTKKDGKDDGEDDLLSFDPFSKKRTGVNSAAKRKPTLRKGGKQRRELCSRNKTLTKTQRIENHEEEEVDDKDDLLSYNPFSGVSNKNDKKVELSANDSIAARKTERNRDKDIGNEKINDESTGCDAALYDENQDIDKAVGTCTLIRILLHRTPRVSNSLLFIPVHVAAQYFF
mmetsp:Transcript_31819/g.46814  ORF Transcript_31819/g.46814 Transcript_31819/m.46814 type:complete len:189 (+) Transcript_31819:101-667(+)